MGGMAAGGSPMDPRAGGSPAGGIRGNAVRLERWLPALLRSRAFFKPCALCARSGAGPTGPPSGGGLVNLFCLDCADEAGACMGCAEAHLGHRMLQIRRSSYHEVVRMQEASKLLNTSGVQPYTINSARVVFLRERPQSRSGKHLHLMGGRHFEGGLSGCVHCGRALQDGFLYCSLNCKLQGLRGATAARGGGAGAEGKMGAGPKGEGVKREGSGGAQGSDEEDIVPEGLLLPGGSRVDKLQPMTPPDTPYRRQKSRSPWVLGRGRVGALSARKSLTKTPPRSHRRKGRPCRAPLA